MDAKETIKKLLEANNPSQFFGANWKDDYNAAILLIHPDRCHEEYAQDAVLKLNSFKEQWRKVIKLPMTPGL